MGSTYGSSDNLLTSQRCLPFLRCLLTSSLPSADMWTTTTQAEEYVDFLRRLLSAIASNDHLREVSEVTAP